MAPDRLYASQSSGWFGQVIQRSDDGGSTWKTVGNDFGYDGVPGEHQWYDGSLRPWSFTRVWHLEPSLHDAETVYAGVEDAALFKSTDGGTSWAELSGLRQHDTGPQWQPGAGGLCLHTIVQHPTDAGPDVRRDLGRRRLPHLRRRHRPGSRSTRASGPARYPTRTPRSVTASTASTCTRTTPDVLYMQKHWDVMRSEDGGDTWHEVSGNLPSDFGFPVTVHAHEPETVYVVPITSDSAALPARRQAARLPEPHRRRRVGGADRAACRRRTATSTSCATPWPSTSTSPAGVYFGTTGGQVYASADSGDSWAPIVRDLPPVLSVEVQTLR